MNQTVKINLFYCLYILNEEIKLGTKLNYLFYKFSFYIFTAGAGAGAAKRGWGLHRNPVFCCRPGAPVSFGLTFCLLSHWASSWPRSSTRGCGGCRRATAPDRFPPISPGFLVFTSILRSFPQKCF